MRTSIISILFLFLFACENPDFWVGPTPIFLETGAQEQIPCDFVSVLKETNKEIQKRHNEIIAIKIMEIPIRLYPDYSTPKSKLKRNVYLNGLKEGGDIHVRLLGSSILDTALLHEQINHCLCEIVYDDVNVYHKNQICALQETEITDIVGDKAESERQGRCSSKNQY